MIFFLMFIIFLQIKRYILQVLKYSRLIFINTPGTANSSHSELNLCHNINLVIYPGSFYFTFSYLFRADL